MRPYTAIVERDVVPGLILTVLLAACGGSGEVLNPIRSFPAGTAWPQVLEGPVEVSVEEGDVADDGLSDVNFGSVETDTGPYMIAIPGSVARAAGLSRDAMVAGGRFRVTLSGLYEYADPQMPTYEVSRLERLP